MKVFEIDLDCFCEDIFHEMERVQDGKNGHVVQFNAEDRTSCAKVVTERLLSFIDSQLNEV